MLLAVDIGNTSTKFGLFEGDELVSRFQVDTHSEDLVAAIEGRLDPGFETAIVCSVVPEAAERLGRLITHGYGVEPFFVASGIDVSLKVRPETVATLGADRFVNSFAASEKYGSPVIACSFGTATTIDFVNEERELVGGMIAPGIGLMARSLNQHTAKLPLIEPSPATALGVTTESAIRAGLYASLVGTLENAVANITMKYGGATVVATGGYAAIAAEGTTVIDVVDADLTLDGLRLISNSLLP